MHERTQAIRRAVLAAGLCLSALIGPLEAHETHEIISLTQAKVSALAGGRYSVTLEAAGDMRGILTLTLHRLPDGTARGEWALVVAHVQDLNPDGTPVEHVHHDEEGEHQERIALIHRGTIGGRVSSAALRFGTDGVLEGIDAIQLEVKSGSREFEGKVGDGLANADDLRVGAAATGVLQINLRSH